jgi:hypothetical protein
MTVIIQLKSPPAPGLVKFFWLVWSVEHNLQVFESSELRRMNVGRNRGFQLEMKDTA